MSGSELLRASGTPSVAPRPTCGWPRRRSTRGPSAWPRSRSPISPKRRTARSSSIAIRWAAFSCRRTGRIPWLTRSSRRGGTGSEARSPTSSRSRPGSRRKRRASARDPRRGTRVPGVGAAAPERPVSAGRDRRVPCLSAAAFAGRVRDAVEREADRRDVFHRYDGALRSSPRLHGARDAGEESEGGGSSRRGTLRRSARHLSSPAPARLDALSEPKLVRLLWDPVDAPDLAATFSIGRRAAAPPCASRPPPSSIRFSTTRRCKVGVRYRYTVRSVDRSGNESSPSPVVIAEPF